MTTTIIKTKQTCRECHETYILAWYEGETEPLCCPFCAAAIVDIGDDTDDQDQEGYSGD